MGDSTRVVECRGWVDFDLELPNIPNQGTQPPVTQWARGGTAYTQSMSIIVK